MVHAKRRSTVENLHQGVCNGYKKNQLKETKDARQLMVLASIQHSRTISCDNSSVLCQKIIFVSPWTFFLFLKLKSVLKVLHFHSSYWWHQCKFVTDLIDAIQDCFAKIEIPLEKYVHSGEGTWKDTRINNKVEKMKFGCFPKDFVCRSSFRTNFFIDRR